MIRLTRPELAEIIRAYIIANTPRSLYKAMIRSSAVGRLKQLAEPKELERLFLEAASKCPRTPLSVAIAYASLAALLTSKKNLQMQTHVDTSRLLWGLEFESLSNMPRTTTSLIEMTLSSPIPTPNSEVYVGSIPRNSKRTTSIIYRSS